MSFRRTATALALACHPGPTVAVTAVTGLLAAAVGHRFGSGLLVTGAVLAGQLSIGWGNDLLDRERDQHSARRDKPVASGAVRPATVRWATLLGAGGCVVLSLLTGALSGTLHLAAVASGWTYNLGLKSTLASAVPFAVSFGLLPAFVVAAAPGPGHAPVWMVTAGALLGTGAHFANVLPDLADDLATGVRGLGHRLGRRSCAAAAAALLLAAVAVLALGPPGPPTAGGWAALVLTVGVGGLGLVLAQRAGSRAAFSSVLIIAVVALILLVTTGTRLR
ncbi:MAG: UbiA family prenyltransferase [Geodermatophilaceae bacterium]